MRRRTSKDILEWADRVLGDDLDDIDGENPLVDLASSGEEAVVWIEEPDGWASPTEQGAYQDREEESKLDVDEVLLDLAAPWVPRGWRWTRRGWWAWGRWSRGARSARLSESWPLVQRSGRWVLVPEAQVRREDELAWCARWHDDDGPSSMTITLDGRSSEVRCVAVPSWVFDSYDRAAGSVVSAELCVWALMGIDDVARLVAVKPATIRSYVTRGQFPEPVARIGGSPVWTRSQVWAWELTRQS